MITYIMYILYVYGHDVCVKLYICRVSSCSVFEREIGKRVLGENIDQKVLEYREHRSV